MEERTLYWLFSTIAQAYGAIIGIVGLLVVYQLENLSRRRGSIRDRLAENEDLQRSFTKLELAGWLPEDIMWQFFKIRRRKDTHLADVRRSKPDRYVSLATQIVNIGDSVITGTSVRKMFLVFMIYHLLIVIISIGCIYSIPLIKPVLGSWSQEIIRIIIQEGFLILFLILIISGLMIGSMTITIIGKKDRRG